MAIEYPGSGIGIAEEDMGDFSGIEGTIEGMDQAFTGLSARMFIDAFENMVEESFPNPEIIRVDFLRDSEVGPITSVKVKVKVSGDFMDDEWFWADFLKYFKLKVYLIPNLDTTNLGLYETSLFSDRNFDVGNYYIVRKGAAPGEGSYEIPSLQNKSNKLENAYIFEGETTISPAFEADLNSRDTSAAVVARTYFDTKSFSEEMLGVKSGYVRKRTKNRTRSLRGRRRFLRSTTAKIDFSPLNDENNGKWDLVEFDIDGGAVGIVTRIDKVYAELNAIGGEKWNGAFLWDQRWARFLATSTEIDPNLIKSQLPATVIFNRRAFEKTNAHLSVSFMLMLQFINTQEEITTAAYNPNKKKKFEEDATLNKAFSDLYVSKEWDGDVNLFFSFDHLELFKQLSIVPDAVFDNIEKDMTQPLVRSVKITDQGGADLKQGQYKYRLGVRVTDKVEEFVLNAVTSLRTAGRDIKIFNQEAQNPSSIDNQTGEFSEDFVSTQANGTLKYLNNAVDIFYNILESNLLRNFAIDEFKLQRYRVKNNINMIEFDNSVFYDDVVQISETAALTFAETSPVFLEYQKLDSGLTYKTDLLITREQLKNTFQIANMNLDKALEFQRILDLFQKQLLSLIRQKGTPSADQNVRTGWNTNTDLLSQTFIEFPDLYNATEFQSGYSFEEPTEIDIVNDTDISLGSFHFAGQKALANSAVDQYLFENVENLNNINKIAPLSKETTLGNVYLNNLSLNQGFDFNFVAAVVKDVDETTVDKEEAAFEALDLGAQKYLISCSPDATTQALNRASTQNLFAALGTTETSAPPVETEYLAGFEVNANGKSVMKSADWRPSTELEGEESGKEFLFRVKRTGKGRQLAIYNEYFLKKV